MPGVKAATPAGSVREDSSSEEEQEEDKSSWSLKIIDPKVRTEVKRGTKSDRVTQPW